MSAREPERESAFHLDRRQVRRAFDRAAVGYDAAAVLQAEVRKRLLERLELTDIRPRTILDLGCGTGRAAAELSKRFRRARVVGMDISEGMLKQSRANRPWLRKIHLASGSAEAIPLARNSTDLLFSSLAIQWVDDLDAAFAEFRRVLREGGLALFTTFGPDTLRELREAWSRVDGFTHVNRFADMHDIGDGLVRAQMAEPVMDIEHITLTYESVYELMRDLKRIGAHNVTAGRNTGMTGRRRMAALADAYEPFRRADGRLPATYEVVYGTVWTPGDLPGAVAGPGGGISPDDLRATIRK